MTQCRGDKFLWDLTLNDFTLHDTSGVTAFSDFRVFYFKSNFFIVNKGKV